MLREKLITAGEIGGVVAFVAGGFVVHVGAGVAAIGVCLFGAARVADQ